MKKKLVAIVALVAFCAVSAAAYAFTCKIKSVEGEKLVVSCKSKDAKKMEAGQKVKVKPKIEGC